MCCGLQVIEKILGAIFAPLLLTFNVISDNHIDNIYCDKPTTSNKEAFIYLNIIVFFYFQ